MLDRSGYLLKRILDGRGQLVPLLGELGPHVLVVGTCGSMGVPPRVWRFSSHLWSMKVLLVLLVLSWTSLRSSVDIRVMSATISRRASILRCRSMMMEK